MVEDTSTIQVYYEYTDYQQLSEINFAMAIPSLDEKGGELHIGPAAQFGESTSATETSTRAQQEKKLILGGEGTSSPRSMTCYGENLLHLETDRRNSSG